MYKYLLENAGDLDWMAVGPMLVFVAFFVGVIVFAYTTDKSYINKMSNLPFEDQE